MKQYSNLYIFIFSSVMVIIVAALLSFVAEQLRPIQEKNIAVEKKLDILRSVGKAEHLDEMHDKDKYIESEYKEFITDSYVINSKGELQEGIDAFTVNLKIELSKQPEERNLPVFIFMDEEGNPKYIIPLRGKGLWGPIWGYISLHEDFSTIYGAVFDHAKETPGLGAEINTDWFQAQFVNKKIFNDSNEFVSIRIKKGGATPDDPSAVDAVSGGTITSIALQKMIYECMANYETYFKLTKSQI